ncbi:MAG: arylsulfatase [Deltaproteobacteria bacterium]|nr:arylsulfatase [Deltaproteobacteria bacterium]
MRGRTSATLSRLLQPLACLLVLGVTHVALAANAQPNFVLILVDDAGFMDFGGYGGEANTPNIDEIADEGVRFTNYHTSPLCAPSRAMLLTGLDNHKTGVATIPEVLTEEQAKSPGYAMHLLPGVRTIADYLSNAGYETFMTGKWHLGRGEGDLPDSHGFDRSFALDASGADNWEQKSFMPFYDEAPWFEDGAPADLPADFYSSKFLVDKMLEYLRGRRQSKPFFAYIAFQAIHIPVQAPREFTDRYQGVYADGWQATLERRFARARELGLVPDDAVMPSMHASLRQWESLSAEEQALYERSMMVNAGMLEAMDHHIGRLVEYLRSSGEMENTVFVITSDNGPEFADPVASAGFRLWMRQNGYDSDIDRLGEKGSMVAIGPEWASAAAVPGSLFKVYASEGGTRVPLIVRGPGIAPRRFASSLNFVIDVAPTIADLAGVERADDMQGRSLVPILTGEAQEIYGDDDVVGLEVAGNAALFKGRHKVTRNTLPHGDATWRLHDLSRDPAEVDDLSEQSPALREELLADYEAYAQAMDVVALPADFDVYAQIAVNVAKKRLADNWPTLVIVGVAILGAALFGGFLLVRRLHRSRQA